MHSGGKMTAAGAIAAAGMSYYEAHKAKKHQKYQTTATKKGVSVDSYIHRANEKEHKKAAKKAKKLGISPDQYIANQARDYNEKMTKLQRLVVEDFVELSFSGYYGSKNGMIE